MFQPELEAMERERLDGLVLERMRAMLAGVSTNAAYAPRLGGAKPGDLGRIDDWRRLPFLTKDELRDAYPFGLAGGGPYRRIQMSSGTTGNPILNPYTPGDIAQWSEVMARCYVAAGVGADDVIQITPSFGLFTGGFGFHYGAERLGAMVIPIGAGRTLLQLKLMRDLHATVLVAIATYPLRLIEVAREERFDLGALALRVGILGSEMWSDELRERCGCGRTALRLDRLRGRTDDMVIFKGVNFYPRQIEQVLLRQPGLGPEYQIVLDGEGGGERLTIHVETEPGCDGAVAARVKRELHDLLGLGPEIRLCRFGEIERPPGKAVRVVDRRKTGAARWGPSSRRGPWPSWACPAIRPSWATASCRT